MATKTVETIVGELVGQKTFPIRLRVTVQEHWVNELDHPVKRTIDKWEAVSLSGIEEGSYTLRFIFDGQQVEQPVRVSYGFLLVE